jgi:bifunctional N-acetylglucosamine-1-phosphate-uridyltransferase/glucosamine-1-phosphate-acetyltransferase GlmU-like protein
MCKTLTLIHRLSELSRSNSADSDAEITAAKLYLDELTQVEEQLSALRSDLASSKLLQEQLFEIQGAKALLEVQASLKDQNIIRMEGQIETLGTENAVLIRKSQYLESTLADRPIIEEGLIERLTAELMEAKKNIQLANETESNFRSEMQLSNEKIHSLEENLRILAEEKIQIESEVSVSSLSVQLQEVSRSA